MNGFFNWLRTDTSNANMGTCFVMGYPSSSAWNSCPDNTPWDGNCKNWTPMFTVQNFKITPANPNYKPVDSETLHWCNDAQNESQKAVHSYSKTVTNTYSTTLTTTMKTSVSVSDKTTVDIEFVKEELDITVSVELDVTSSETHTQSTSVTKSQDNTVNVGPRSKVANTCTILQGTCDAPFEGDYYIMGNMVWACADTEDWHSLWVWPKNTWSGSTMQQWMESANFDTTYVMGRHFTGTFNAVQSEDVTCSTHVDYLKDGESCSSEPATRPVA